ncbi:MAG TPA: inorganic phosphate transporter [Verrucomicrobiales bacterium]|nr:inorganic phosphate transporter [Verrucomicrobiales bacterium]
MDLFLVFTVVFVALVFTYTNGFHDTANAIATVVGTKVLTPRQAILLAAVTNLVGAFFGLAVAKTISSGLVEAKFITQQVLICALISAIAWNLLTWWFGLPSSSSHALIGSLVGAALASAHGDWSAIKWSEVKPKAAKILVQPSPEVLSAIGTNQLQDGTTFLHIGTNKVAVVEFGGRVMMVAEKASVDKAGILHKVVIPMITSPVVGFGGGLLFMALLYALLRSWKPMTVNRVFGKLQLASSAYMGFSHGMNDATKCMGIITLALVAGTKAGLFDHVPAWLHFLYTPEGSDVHKLTLGDWLESWLPGFLQFGYMPTPGDPKSQGVPDWVVVLCALTMAAGTAAGGWRIIKTLGHKMVKLQPVHGFAAETTAATVLAVAGSMGMPISTTHAITTSIMGVGCAKRFSALKLRVIERIVWAWILTLPAAAGVAYLLVQLGRVCGFVQN